MNVTDGFILLAGVGVVALAWRGVVFRGDGVGREVSAWSPARWLLGALGAYAALAIAGGLGTMVSAVSLGPPPVRVDDAGVPLASLPHLAMTSAISYPLAIAAGWWIAFRWVPEGPAPAAGVDEPARLARAGLVLACSWRSLRRDLWWSLLMLPVVMATGVCATAIYRLATGSGPEPLAHTFLRVLAEQGASPWAWLLMLGATVGAPAAEELIYRVLVQSGLRSAMGPGAGRAGAMVAVTATSVLFTLVHVGSAAPVALPVLLVLSLIMGAAYERSRSVLTPVIMHAVFNTANLALAMMAA